MTHNKSDTTRVNRVGGSRVDGVVTWIGWHLAELVGVCVPLVGATVTTGLTSGLCWTGTGLALAGWAAHEIGVGRRHRAALAALPASRPELTGRIGAPEGSTSESTSGSTTGSTTEKGVRGELA
jgi:hypothetical protein